MRRSSPHRRRWSRNLDGGVVSLNGKCFGLTVAHGLFDYGMLSEEMGDGDWSLEYDSVDEDSIPGTCEFFPLYLVHFPALLG